MRRLSVALLMFAWLAQQALLPLHAQSMARMNPLTAAFCGLTSSPQALSLLVASAPPELMVALKRSAKTPDTNRLCAYCLSAHLQVFAGPPALPSLSLIAASALREFFAAGVAIEFSALGFQARGPPQIQVSTVTPHSPSSDGFRLR